MSATTSEGEEPQSTETPDVSELLLTSTEMETSESVAEPIPSTGGLVGATGSNEIPGVSITMALLSVSVCCDLFHHLAHRRYSLATSEARVTQMASDHPFFYRVCRWIDLVTRLLLVLVLIATVSLVTWGVIRRTFFIDGFTIP